MLLIALFISAFACTNTQQKMDEIQLIERELSSKKEIESSKIIKLLSRGKDIVLANKKIIGDLDFTKIGIGTEELKGVYTHYITASIVFKNCEFKGKIISSHLSKQILHRSFFMKNITFMQCVFEDEVEIKQSTIQGICNFSESVFNRKLSLETSVFYANVFLDKVTVQEGGRFQNIICYQDFSCIKSHFYAMTSFQRAILKGNIMCSSTEFHESVDFGLITVYHDFLFNYNVVPAKISFNYMNCRGKFECLSNKFSEMIRVRHTVLEKKVKWAKNTTTKSPNFSETIFYQRPIIDSLDLIKKDNIYIINNETK